MQYACMNQDGWMKIVPCVLLDMILPARNKQGIKRCQKKGKVKKRKEAARGKKRRNEGKKAATPKAPKKIGK